ncbi:MAG: hypothetical protein JNG89_21150 [Planctomycetaceae bacterium]|nr:hypothetical protein [Planctomycetaceae bacterium]
MGSTSDVILIVLGGALLVGGSILAQITQTKSGLLWWEVYGRRGWQSREGRLYWAGSFAVAVGIVLLLIAAYDPCVIPNRSTIDPLSDFRR